MKSTSFSRIALLAGAFSIAGLTGLRAQDDSSTTPASPAPGAHHWHHSELTPEERAELKKDMDQVMTANPELKTEGETLHQQMHDHMKKVDAAIVAADPNAAPILAKLEAHHHHGPPPSDDSASPDNGSTDSNQ